MKLHILLPLVVATPLIAKDIQTLDAHEHGVGALNIAFDGANVAMEFIAPGADIVGFEYEAKSNEDIAAVESALAALADPATLFSFTASADCQLISADAELESEESEGHDDHHDDDHSDHGHDDHTDDSHDDHDDHGHDDHADDSHDDHDDHDNEASHTEFHAAYTFKCAQPDDATQLTFGYFDVFENAREVHVQVITGSGASAFDVERDAPVLDLKDAM